MKTITTNIFYVYKHTWGNTNYIYIGKGSGNRINSKKRNIFWKNITAKYGLPIKEIIKDNMSEEDAFLLEEKLIGKYKKYMKIVNITSGGEGATGLIHSKETREKIRQSSLGRGHSLKTKEILSEIKQDKNIYTFYINGIAEKGTTREIANKYKVSLVGVRSIITGAQKSHKGITFIKELANYSYVDNTVYNFNHVSGIKERLTRQELCDKYNLPTNGMWSVINKNRKSKQCKGWYLEGTNIISKSLDSKSYTFYNKEKNITFDGTRVELRDNYDIDLYSISKIITRSRKSAKGWIVL